MKLQKITIDNFRCFKHFEITMAKGVSLLIGRNGVGKTSLIKAIVYSLHFIFTNDKSMGDDFLSAGNPDLKMSSLSYGEFYREPEGASASADANFHGEMLYGDKHIVWDMYRRSTSGSSLYPSKYLAAYHDFMNQYKENNILPVIAYFSDSFPHKESNVSSFAKKQIDSFGGVLRNFGYYQWDNENACTTIWQQRLVNALIKSASIDDVDDFSSCESRYVIDLMIKFSKPITENCDTTFEIKKVFFAFAADKKPELWLRMTSGRDIPFSDLPAGYLRIYSIVLDIAYRAFILNRNANLNPVGLVIIDEIDLHLHPSLALEIVERFTKTFEEIQFIISTHSPIVMSRLPDNNGNNKIFKLISGNKGPSIITDNNVYGIDYNSILTDFLGINQYEDDINFLVKSIEALRKMGRDDLVEKRKKELLNLVGEAKFNKLMNDHIE